MFRTFVIVAALASLSGAAFAMGGTVPSDAATAAANREKAAEAAVPQSELTAVQNLLNQVVTIRNDPGTDATEKSKTNTIAANLTKATYAAITARTNANRAEFDKQARLARTYHGQACAILSGC